MTLTIFTVGHSNRSFEELIRILKKYNIETIVDVRSFPTSKKYPWFNRESLEIELPKFKIKYIWLKDLGGYRRGGYEKYQESEQYKIALDDLISLAKESRVAIMCAEKLWFKCHRRFISNDLVRRGIEVIHIIDLKRTQKHKLKEQV
ncbi:MAG: DUF488 domain-containing protein [Candidatus Odinarchaeota archaeon]|nr:DUF488 domain-containing protein [Candidatus Odinarchaeota archaeon]